MNNGKNGKDGNRLKEKRSAISEDGGAFICFNWISYRYLLAFQYWTALYSYGKYQG